MCASWYSTASLFSPTYLPSSHDPCLSITSYICPLFLLLRVYRNVLSFLHDVVALRVLVLVKFCLIVDTLETITIRKHSLNIELHHKTSAVHFAEYQLVIKEEDMNVRSNNVVAKKTLGRALKKFVGDFKVCYCTQTTF